MPLILCRFLRRETVDVGADAQPSAHGAVKLVGDASIRLARAGQRVRYPAHHDLRSVKLRETVLDEQTVEGIRVIAGPTLRRIAENAVPSVEG